MTDDVKKNAIPKKRKAFENQGEKRQDHKGGEGKPNGQGLRRKGDPTTYNLKREMREGKVENFTKRETAEMG